MSPLAEPRTGGHQQWEHVNDAKERKKIQNRNAQRAYRERSKRRVEVLEQLCQSSENTGLLRHDLKCSRTATGSQRVVRSNGAAQKQYRAQSEVTPVNSISLGTSSTPPLDETYPEIEAICNAVNEYSGTSSLDLCWAFDSSPDLYDLASTATASCLDDTTDLTQNLGVEITDDGTIPFEKSLPPRSTLPSDGQTALHIAAGLGRATTVATLLQMSADVLARDNLGRTALHVAVERSQKAVVVELVKHEPLLDEINKNGDTALHVSVSMGDEQVVLLLLGAAVDVELKNGNGLTALHIAAMHGKEVILKLLLEQGADIDARI